jgi:hypothetical protein
MAFIGHDIVDLTDPGRLFRPYHKFYGEKDFEPLQSFF